MPQELTKPITRSIQGVIVAVDDDVSLEEPLIAINWFDTKSALLYDIYNFFAARSVRTVGGQVVFKGRIEDTLVGALEDRRDMILIVRYPSGQDFLRMLQSKYFQIVSVMRGLAVSHFTFGFTQPLTPATDGEDADKSKPYLICHFQGDGIGPELSNLAEEFGLKTVYAGTVAARLATRNATGAETAVPNLMRDVLVLQAEQSNNFMPFIKSPKFDRIAGLATSMFVAQAKRLM